MSALAHTTWSSTPSKSGHCASIQSFSMVLDETTCNIARAFRLFSVPDQCPISSQCNGIVNGREVARHVTAVLPGVASKNIMSDMQASCWMQTLGSREFPQHALQAIHVAFWNPMSRTRATAPCIRLLHLVGPQLVRTVNKWFARTQNSTLR